ncbi:MAG: hypothetical protein AB1498_02730 [bacterium]
MSQTTPLTEIELYEILKSKLGDKEAKSVIEYVEAKVDRKFADKSDILATKEDLANLKAEIIKWMFLFWVGQIASLIVVRVFFK